LIVLISGRQIWAGRLLLAWSRDDLAREAGLSLRTIQVLEPKADTSSSRGKTIDAIENAFRRHGVRLMYGGAVMERAMNRREYSLATLLEIGAV
jgi:hypothetical protein